MVFLIKHTCCVYIYFKNAVLIQGKVSTTVNNNCVVRHLVKIYSQVTLFSYHQCCFMSRIIIVLPSAFSSFIHSLLFFFLLIRENKTSQNSKRRTYYSYKSVFIFLVYVSRSTVDSVVAPLFPLFNANIFSTFCTPCKYQADMAVCFLQKKTNKPINQKNFHETKPHCDSFSLYQHL